MKWVLDEPTFPRTTAAVGQIWRGARTEKGEARTGGVGDSKWGAGEVDGAIGNREQLRQGAIPMSGGWNEGLRSEIERG